MQVCPGTALVYLLLSTCYVGLGEDFVAKDDPYDSFDLMLGDDPTVTNDDGDTAGSADNTQTPQPRPVNLCTARQGAVSQICMNYPAKVESMLHTHLKRHLELGYLYQAVANHFHRDDQALDGYADYFEKQSDRKLHDARKLYKYITKRGGNINYYDISRPKKHVFKHPKDAMHKLLMEEKTIHKMLLDLHWIATDKNDPHMTNYLDNEFIDQQVSVIKDMGEKITRLKRINGDGVGLHLLDKELHG